MHNQFNKTSGNRNRVPGFLRLFALSLLIAAFAFTSLHAQTVAYVTNSNNTVSVVDTSTNTLTATIAVGDLPAGVSFSPDGTRAYVVNQGLITGNSSISVIDTASNTVVATVALAPNSFPLYAAATPDGKFLYVAEQFSRNVEVVSTAANSVVATIPVGGLPCSVAITPDGAHGYVATENDSVSVIATATNTISVASIPVTSDPARGSFCLDRLAVTPSGDAVYVPGIAQNVVSVISTATNTVSATVTLPPPPGRATLIDLAITPDGSRVYVPDSVDNQVDVIDTATNTLEPTAIPVGSSPLSVAVTPDGSLVYVVNATDNTLSVISTATNTVVATIAAPGGPFIIAIANKNAPMATLTIDNLVINNNLHEQGDFTLGANTSGLDLAHQPVTITVNNFSLTIPPGSFKQVGGNMHFVFNGTVNGFKVNFNIQAEHGSSTQFDLVLDVHGVSITGPDPANVSLGIGHNTGSTTAPF